MFSEGFYLGKGSGKLRFKNFIVVGRPMVASSAASSRWYAPWAGRCDSVGGWGVVRGCNLVNCPLGRSFSVKCFGRGFGTRGVSTRCMGFRVPHVRSFVRIVRRGPGLYKLGIAVPCGRRIVPCLSRLSGSATGVNTIGIVGVVHLPGNGIGLINCGSSVVKFARSVRPLLRPRRGGTLVLNANNTSGTMCHKLRGLDVGDAFMSHTGGRSGCLACRRLAPGVVRRCAIVIGYAPMNVCPGISFYPGVPCRLLAPGRLLCSLLCGPGRALFVGGNRTRKTIAGGNLRVLLLRTFTT